MTQSYNIPLTITATHHGAPVATSMGTAVENPTCVLRNSGDPWKFTWKNVENWRTGTAPQASETGTIPTQAWALTAASATSSYQGQVLFYGLPATGMSSNQSIGTFMITYKVLFRCRQ